MIFSRAMAYACLNVLAGILALVAALLILLTLVQFARGEAVPDPAARAVGTAVAAILALGCRAVARRAALRPLCFLSVVSRSGLFAGAKPGMMA